MLTQMIEGACSDCDLIGEQGVNEFIQHLTELCACCNEKKGYRVKRLQVTIPV